MSCAALTSRAWASSTRYDPVGNYERVRVSVTGSGESLIQPLLDNQLERQHQALGAKPPPLHIDLEMPMPSISSRTRSSRRASATSARAMPSRSALSPRTAFASRPTRSTLIKSQLLAWPSPSRGPQRGNVEWESPASVTPQACAFVRGPCVAVGWTAGECQ